MLPLDLQRKIATLLCYTPRTVGVNGAQWVQDESVPLLTGLHNNIRAMRLVSHAHRTLINSTVKRVHVPHHDFWGAPHDLCLPHGQYPAVTLMDLRYCSITQATTVLRHCFENAQRFPSVARLAIGPFIDGHHSRRAPNRLHEVLRRIYIPTLQHLRVSLGSPPDDWLRLPNLPLDYRLFSSVAQLVSLEVSTGTWRTNPFTSALDFPHLLDLCLDDCDGVHDHIFTHISAMTRLERLSIRNTIVGVGTCPIPHLPALTSLTCLNLSHTHVTNHDIAPFTALRQLQRLLLESTWMMESWDPPPAPRPRGFGRPHATETLSQLTALTCLNLRHTQCAQGAHRLSSLTRLRQLHLGGATRDLHSHTWGVSDTGLQHLTTLTQLTRLQVPNNGGIGRAGLQAIARMSALQELDLRSTACTDSDLPFLRGLPALRVLALDKWEGHLDAGFALLLGATSLRSVSVGKCRLSASVWLLLRLRPDLRSRRRQNDNLSYHIIDCGPKSTSCVPHWRYGNTIMHSLRTRTSYADW